MWLARAFRSALLVAWLGSTLASRSILLVSRAEVMIDRDSWGCSYCRARGEILGFW